MHPSFEHLWSRDVGEISSKVLFFRHKKTKAEVMVIENDDDNKVFAINFRTLPTDSTGVAHILEHSVLCGSEKYPVKEAFKELAKGSVYTFLNAWTFPDKTVYPIASQNIKDFYNLADVYINAVLFPLLTEEVLAQEGWHYEIKGDELSYKGVVFNEMKGNYSDPHTVLGEQVIQSLSPDTCYGIDSGGDPKIIPNLTLKQLTEFHQQYYHPSNSQTLFYGNGDTTKHLEFLADYFDRFENQKVVGIPNVQTPFAEPHKITVPYPVSKKNDNGYFHTMNWLLPADLTSEERLGLVALGYILVNSDAAILRDALLGSGIGESVVGLGMELDLYQPIFSVGLQNINEKDIPKLQMLITKTLEELVEKGIDIKRIDGTLNQIDFYLREYPGSAPKGLNIFVLALRAWQYGRDPLESISFEADMDKIRRRVEKGEKFLEGLIEKYILNNSHQTFTTLEPDTEMEQRQLKDESERLTKAKQQSSVEDLKRIKEFEKRFQSWQETPDSDEALATLPMLELSDLSKKTKVIDYSIMEKSDYTILNVSAGSSGIVYLNIAFPIDHLSAELLPYANLLTDVLFKLGTSEKSHSDLAIDIDIQTGGIGAELGFLQSLQSPEQKAVFTLGSKARDNKFPDLLRLLGELIGEIDFSNKERLRQILSELKADLETGAVADEGFDYASSRASAGLSQIHKKSEIAGGITFVQFLRQMMDDFDNNWPQIRGNFESVYKAIFCLPGVVTSIVSDSKSVDSMIEQLDEFMQALPSAPKQVAEVELELSSKEAYQTTSQVNYVLQNINLSRAGYKRNGELYILINQLNNDFGWRRIRQQGGAYGGGAFVDIFTPGFRFYSYRDPNVVGTLKTYAESVEYLRSKDLSQTDLLKAIIRTVGVLDKYQTPEEKGDQVLRWYLTRSTPELRQQLRDEVFSTKVDACRKFADVLEQAIKSGVTTAVFGNEAKLKELLEKDPEFKLTVLW